MVVVLYLCLCVYSYLFFHKISKYNTRYITFFVEVSNLKNSINIKIAKNWKYAYWNNRVKRNILREILHERINQIKYESIILHF